MTVILVPNDQGAARLVLSQFDARLLEKEYRSGDTYSQTRKYN